MKVIVAGFPKTGTKTLKSALEILGYSVYDYIENVWILEKEWGKILNEGWTTDDFRRMYENIDAVTDAPACYFWEEIHKAFPDAKIILMTRDEESWFRSVKTQLQAHDENFSFIMMTLFSPSARHIAKRVGNQIGSIILGTDIHPVRNRKINKELLQLKYRSHNAYVLQNAPKDKLFIFECSQGWKALCNFLDVPVPEVEFPHANKKAGIMKEIMATHPIIQHIKREMFISIAVLTAGVAVGSYFIWTRGPANLLNSGKNIWTNFVSLF